MRHKADPADFASAGLPTSLSGWPDDAAGDLWLVAAEGVETAQQLETLHQLGCDAAQGFLLARPLMARAITKLISAPSQHIQST